MSGDQLLCKSLAVLQHLQGKYKSCQRHKPKGTGARVLAEHFNDMPYKHEGRWPVGMWTARNTVESLWAHM